VVLTLLISREILELDLAQFAFGRLDFNCPNKLLAARRNRKEIETNFDNISIVYFLKMSISKNKSDNSFY
jgi:hypothetical protein